MGKGFNHLEKNTMQVSKDLLWGMLKNRNAFLYKRKRVQFTKDPLSVNNRHSASNFAMIADTNKMNVNVSGKSLTMETVCKGKRSTVNAVPKNNRKGDANPKYKARRSNKPFMLSHGQIHDKNAATRYANCPALSRRIAKLHRANLKAARNAAKADASK